MKKNIRTEKAFVFKRWSRKGWGVLASLHRHTTIGTLSVSMSIVLLSTTILKAQPRAASGTDSLRVQLQQATVDASRPPQLRSLGAVLPVFSRLDGAAASMGTLESVLRTHPAVDVRERGGFASQADIHLRGGSADQTQIMLNGIDFTDARTGHQSHALPVDLETIGAIDFIEDISGIGAFAGAVNFRTVPLASDYIRLEGYGGSFGYAGASLSGAAEKGGFSFFGSSSWRRSDGYRHNTDFDNLNAYARVMFRSARAGTIDAQGGYQRRSFGSNGFYAAYNPDQWEQTSTGLTSLRWLYAAGDFKVRVYGSYRKNFDRYDWKRGTPMNRHETDNAGAGVELKCSSVAGVTSLGGDYRYHHIYSTNLGLPMDVPMGVYTHEDDRHVGNVWLSHVAEIRKFSLSACVGAGLTPYGNRFLWNVGLGYRPDERFLIEAGAVQSTRLPTFTDLYYTSPAQVNNLELVPEDAVTFRLKGAFHSGPWSAALGTWYRMGRNIIDWVWHDEGEFAGKWHSEQTGRLGTFGAEVTAAYRPENTVVDRIVLGYAYILANRNEEIISKNAMDHMRNKAALEVALRFPHGFRLTVSGSVYDRAGKFTYYPVPGDASQSEVRDYASFALLDARFSWSWRFLELYLDGGNLTDTRYADIGGLPMPGITFRAGCIIKQQW